MTVLLADLFNASEKTLYSSKGFKTLKYRFFGIGYGFKTLWAIFEGLCGFVLNVLILCLIYG